MLSNSMKLFNNLTKQKEELTDNIIYWYTCGPTVYDHSHLGHARTYLAIDIMKRVIRRKKKIVDIMNITDIDDKIINKATSNKLDWYELARKFEDEYFIDMQTLGIKRPSIVTRVSDYIPEIIEFIQKLLDNGYAYVSNSSVYFDVHKYVANGGKFNFREFNPDNTNISEDGIKPSVNPDKKNKEDFALWKKSGDTQDIGWNTPFIIDVKGRPGWHIECSVMSMDVLSKVNGHGRMTIHSGGIDLEFPHHENEIIQSQSYLGLDTEPWSKFFVHTGHLHIEGLKMSKSLKNFITIKEFLQGEDNGPNVLRMMTLLSKYNKTMNYSVDYTEYSRNELKKIENYVKHMENYNRQDKHQKFDANLDELNKFRNTVQILENCLDDDFDTPNALHQLFALIELGYSTTDSYTKNLILDTVNEYYNLFGFTPKLTGGFTKVDDQTTNDNHRNKYLDIILKIRDDIRDEAKDNKLLYKLSDKIRDVYLKGEGIQDL